jgi:hypothetical protein
MEQRTARRAHRVQALEDDREGTNPTHTAMGSSGTIDAGMPAITGSGESVILSERRVGSADYPP